MPIMTRMRDSMPVILFGLLIAFLVTIIFEWGMDYLGMRGTHSDLVGKVDGKKISYKEFEEVVKNYTQNQRAKAGADLDEEQVKQAREQVWQSMVTQHLLDEQVIRLGITVSDQELVDWVHGDNPPEDLRRYFLDSTGQFRKDMYEQVLSNPNQFVRDPKGSDPSYGTKWLSEVEKGLRLRRLQEKLQSVVLASVRVGEGEVRQRYEDQHEQFDALYALVDAGAMVKDTDVQLTDADLKAYYEENLDQYKFDASRKLKYVQFLEVASASDTASRRAEIEDAAAKAKGGMDFLQLGATYSEKLDSGAFFRHGELSTTLEGPVFAAKVGDVVGPILDANGFHLIKVLDARTSDKEYLHASHILFSLTDQPDSNEVKATAQKVARAAREGKSFSDLAMQYSKDPGSAQRGGDLGWFTKGRMVKAFEEAAFKARPGEIVGPIRTQFGLHIIKIHGRDSRELKISDIRIAVTPSSQTKSALSERAQDFAYNAKQAELVKEAHAIGVEVKETQVLEKGGVVPGIGVNESIMRWAFQNKVGSISDPLTIPNGYAVFMIAEAKDAGVKPFEETKESVRPLALRKKKLEKAKELAAALRASLGPKDSLTKVSDHNPTVKVQRTGSFTLGGSVPGIGRDMSFLGAVAGLSLGEISPPVQGFRGAYLIQLVARTPFDSSAYAQQKDGLRAQLLQDKRNRYLSDWLAKLKEGATIEDHRDMFYR